MDDDDTPIDKLCKVCASIFAEHSYERWSRFWHIWEQIQKRTWPSRRSRKSTLPEPGRHHQSPQDVERAKIWGCTICFTLYRCLRYMHEFPLRYSLQIDSWHDTTHGEIICYRLNIRGVIFIIRSISSHSTLERLGIRSRRRIWTGHEDFAKLARVWINDCLENHAACSKRLLPEWKPTRLLDISQDDIKLVSGEPGVSRPYVTLSHCWGKENFFVLTPDLLPHFLAGVRISEFPLTFQETITTVRRLGIYYLWIDCYCILQGDNDQAREDWKYESLYMGKIYSNSLLNIGALYSASPIGGLFRHIPSLPNYRPAKILWSPTHQDKPITFYFKCVLYLDGLYGAFDIGMKNSTLMKRGWVIQECVLAQRMLSFGKGDIFWQCSQLAASGTYPRGRLYGSQDHCTEQYRLPFWILKAADVDNRSGLKEIKVKWINTLGAYFNSRLSYPEKDLFMALDGIGTEVAKSFRSRFRYGMLASTFPEALLHVTNNKGNQFIRSQFIRNKTKPTWHWSSCYPDVSTDVVESLYSGSKGPVFPLAYAFMSRDCKPLPDDFSGDYWPNLLLIGRLMTELPSAQFRLDGEPPTWQPIGTSRKIFYLPLVNFEYELFRHDRWKGCRGLILEKSESGAYHRVGTWHTSNEYLGRTWSAFNQRFTETPPQLIVLE